VRFTHKADAIYAILLDKPPDASVTLSRLHAAPGMTANLLGLDDPLAWQQSNDGITVSFPVSLTSESILALKLVPPPSI
jgi:hypothetical protein